MRSTASLESNVIDFVERQVEKLIGANVAKLDSPKLLSNIPLFQSSGQVAQSVEQRTENPRVGGSIPSLATFLLL